VLRITSVFGAISFPVYFSIWVINSKARAVFSRQLVYAAIFWQAYLLDIAVPNSHNITQTYNTKINKYLELSVAMRNLWCLEKNSILPLIISTRGIVSQPLFKNLKILDLGNTLVVEIQKGIITILRIAAPKWDGTCDDTCWDGWDGFDSDATWWRKHRLYSVNK
jgi:hypothetical protein